VEDREGKNDMLFLEELKLFPRYTMYCLTVMDIRRSVELLQGKECPLHVETDRTGTLFLQQKEGWNAVPSKNYQHVQRWHHATGFSAGCSEKKPGALQLPKSFL
jgi:hypothetical protein